MKTPKRIKKTVFPPNFEGCRNLVEYNRIKDTVSDFNNWVERIRRTKKVYYLND